MRAFLFLLISLGILIPTDAFMLSNSPTTVAVSKGVKTIVIDPGHGGKDHGCSGKHSKEKHLALKIAKHFGALIEQNLPEVKVHYTRTTDVFIPLYERAQLANSTKADVFISIHCNAIVNKSYIKGTETFVWNMSNSNSTTTRENEVIYKEENFKENYGYDLDTDAGHILSSLFEKAYQDLSYDLATKIEDEVKYGSTMESRGVKSGNLLVLRMTDMPSVLVETGFLTNVQDEKFLMTEAGQIEMANVLYRAFRSYKTELEANLTSQEDHVLFKVQLAAASTKLSIDRSPWNRVSNIEMDQVDGIYRYLSGGFLSFQEAVNEQNYLRQIGFNDAFVVAYRGNQRMDLEDAKELVKSP